MSDSAQSTITTVLVSLLGGGTLGVAAKAWLESRRARDDGERAIRAAEREDTADFARAERAERQARDARIEEMHEELRRVSVEVATCQAEHARAREHIGLMEQLTSRLKVRVDELTNERDEARAERDELLRHVRSLGAQVGEQREQIETLTERVIALAEGRPPSSPPAPPRVPLVAQTAQDVRRYAGVGFRPPTRGEE